MKFYLQMLLLLTFFQPTYSFAKKRADQNNEPLHVSTLESLHRTIHPRSLIQQLAFYELYPETSEGKKALKIACGLLFGDDSVEATSLTLPDLDVYSMIGLVNKQWKESDLVITEKQLSVIDKAASRLEHKKLDGNYVWTKEEVLNLPPEEVDLARALLIYQFESDSDQKQKIKEYEATLDLMALQILAKLKKYPSPEEIITEINDFIFHEMKFRFPPHSLYAKDIDMYTFLPSVMDSRLGVCLGVSTLYICLAQRLGLDLEIITPPGHIYLRYNNGNKLINIETTARGIHLPTETYLGINTQYLQRRNIKEVVGLAFFNQASVMSAREDHKGAIRLYEISLQYVKDEPLFKMLLGMHYLFDGQKVEGT
ncbi:MAG: hypothetical protein FJZ57_07775, partial [Chlamydiae bacterium]|nr:hypothetical protein [Chlamydiota bacterium]